MRGRGRVGERREGERERERQTDRQIDRQTDRQRECERTRKLDPDRTGRIKYHRGYLYTYLKVLWFGHHVLFM